jgi:hypothetical protein
MGGTKLNTNVAAFAPDGENSNFTARALFRCPRQPLGFNRNRNNLSHSNPFWYDKSN